MKNLLQLIKEQLKDIYLGALLFVLLPIMVAFYFDWRAGVLSSIVLQIAFTIFYIVRSK